MQSISGHRPPIAMERRITKAPSYGASGNGAGTFAAAGVDVTSAPAIHLPAPHLIEQGG